MDSRPARVPDPGPSAGEVAEFVRLAAQGIDDACGAGHAASHPALVRDFVRAWVGAERARRVQQQAEALARDLREAGLL